MSGVIGLSKEAGKVFNNVATERRRQLKLWGLQSHPSGTQARLKPLAEGFRQKCELQFALGEGTWLDILLEEVFEAAAEPDEQVLRAELVQIAAVAMAWIEDLDTRIHGNVLLSQSKPTGG